MEVRAVSFLGCSRESFGNLRTKMAPFSVPLNSPKSLVFLSTIRLVHHRKLAPTFLVSEGQVPID